MRGLSRHGLLRPGPSRKRPHCTLTAARQQRAPPFLDLHAHGRSGPAASLQARSIDNPLCRIAKNAGETANRIRRSIREGPAEKSALFPGRWTDTFLRNRSFYFPLHGTFWHRFLPKKGMT